MTAPEQMRAALRAELERQCNIGAGEFSVCPETGLWQVNADLDIDSLLRALTRPAPAELVEALDAAVTKLEAERDELLCSFCLTDNGVPDRSTLSADDAPFVDEFETVIEQARSALRNAGAAS